MDYDEFEREQWETDGGPAYDRNPGDIIFRYAGA